MHFFMYLYDIIYCFIKKIVTVHYFWHFCTFEMMGDNWSMSRFLLGSTFSFLKDTVDVYSYTKEIQFEFSGLYSLTMGNRRK